MWCRGTSEEKRHSYDVPNDAFGAGCGPAAFVAPGADSGYPILE